MEKLHLPVMHEEPPKQARESERVRTTERKLEIHEKIALAFLRQRYPLSPEGEQLKAKIEELIQSSDTDKLQEHQDRLPTVEHPHLELFEDFDMTEEQREEIFYGLADVQVTKGCRHKCTFCAAGAAEKVETMPFAAVLKIAEQKQKADRELVKLWEGWGDTLREAGITPERYTPFIDQLFDQMKQTPDLSKAEHNFIEKYEKLYEEIKEDQPQGRGLGDRITDFLLGMSRWISDEKNPLPHLTTLSKNFYILYEQTINDIKQLLEQRPIGHYLTKSEEYNDTEEHFYYGIPFDGVASEEAEKSAERRRGVTKSFGGLDYQAFPGRSITNYYDSDVFDYKDSTLLHEDGTAAHYGDVFDAMASETRPIHVTTVGFPKKDASAQRAAEMLRRLYEINPKRFGSFRISVNPYEATARRDFDRYLEDILNTIETLNGIKELEVIIFNDVDDHVRQIEFLNKVIEPLKKMCSKKGSTAYISHVSDAGVSSYSGHRRTESIREEDHHDVMACLPGIHIWPNGTVAEQATFQKKKGEGRPRGVSSAPKGSRPSPAGIQLFELGEKKMDLDLGKKSDTSLPSQREAA